MLASARIMRQNYWRPSAFSRHLYGGRDAAAAAARADRSSSALQLRAPVRPGRAFGARGIWSMIPMSPPPLPPIIQKRAVDNNETFRHGFMAALPHIFKDLTDAGCGFDVPCVSGWLAKSLQYNESDGKMNYGLEVVLSYKTLCPESELNDENLKLTHVLGWCVEILQAFQLVLDDMMVNTIARRGHSSWYGLNDTGLTAIHDSILLERAVNQLLSKHFKNKSYYTHIMDLFHDVTVKSSMGQYLDMLVLNSYKFKKLENYTMDNYTAIVKYKTAYNSFFLPVALAILMTNIDDPNIFRQVKTISLKTGHFFQVQDDFLDCYGDLNVIDKIGTDIEDGKCSWLAVAALEKANPQQKKIMEDNYGIDDPANVAVIKDLYEQLKLPNAFHLYKEESHDLIRTHIQQVSQGPLQDLFFNLLKKIHKKTL